MRTDLHFHLLPGLDDGPVDFAETLALALAAVADGTGTVVATPHVRFDLGTTNVLEIRDRVRELQARLSALGVPLDVRCGGELGHDVIGTLSQGELELMAQGPSGSRWLLVETPFDGIGAGFHEAATELRERGFGVLVAHPERSADAVLDGSDGLRRELAAGSFAQVNAQSLTGEHGDDAHAAAWRLIREGLVAVVASDAHGPTRPPVLSAAWRALLHAGLPRSSADHLVESGPRRLLESGVHPRAALVA